MYFVKMRSYWITMGTNSNYWCLYKMTRGHLDAELKDQRMLYEDGSRGQPHSYSPSIAKDYWKQQVLGKMQGRILS
jgi:hypothetical protein